ncbi:hypothetical protein BCR35DRAFT_300067 [Leucosporidium creatinivorum]|uniref:Protein CPL1-like domain-containing protein n=1 Tax=Leucosporidium creatinivorum TaxID=106004 RepID=A0A1Y2G3P9_9BASI|nr:hypothetical protein BCR35DRAFT_300067 [Leucosporidium creatinivorum]
MPSLPPPPKRLLALLTTFFIALSSVHAQSGRIKCMKGSQPNQAVCDQLQPATSRRAMRVPIDSECHQDAYSGDWFCGFAGAACTEHSQCDFSHCSSEDGEEGVCLSGGLGDSCEGAEGADDSLCAGNLGCSPLEGTGGAVCGGLGAECLYTGSYVPGDVPNHQACLSGHCDASTLTCARAPARPKVNLSPGALKKELLKQKKKKKAQSQRLKQQQQQQLENRQKQLQLEQQRLVAALHPPYAAEEDEEVTDERSEVDDEIQDVHHVLSVDDINIDDEEAPVEIAVPAGSACPRGFTLCPVARGLSSGRFDFGCFDTRTSVNMCGGCAGGPGAWNGMSKGQDCLAAPGVVSAACVESQCRVFSCSPNYEFDRATGTCRPQWYQ